MATVNMAEKLWDIANIVTGFSVAQSLATVFMLAKDEMKLLKDDTGYRMMRIGAFVFTLFYLAVIVLCGVAGASRDADNGPAWAWVTVGRSAAVIFFTLALYGTIYGHRHAKAEQARPKPLLDKQKGLI